LQPPGRLGGADKVETHVFHLKYIRATEATRILRDLLGNEVGPKGALRLSVEEDSNTLLVRGDPDRILQVAAILQRIDVEAADRAAAKPEPATGDYQVRVFWLVNNPDRKEAGELAGDLRDVAAELGKMGIDRIRLAAQVAVAPGGRFELNGTAKLDMPYHLAVAGTAADRKGAVGIELSVSVTYVPTAKQSHQVDSLRTRVTAPLGRSVVLGIIPTEGTVSAFVLRVTRPEPSRQTARKGKAFSFEFRNKPWKAVLEWLSDQTGLPFIGHSPTGTFTFQGLPGQSYTVPQIIDILNEALQEQKSLLIRRPNSLTVVPADETIDPALATRVRPQELEQYGKTERLAMTLPLQEVQAEAVAGDVRKLLGPFGAVQVLKAANRLEVQDTAENLRRVYQLIQELEKPRGK
jgi:hypothetical protein